MPSPPLASIAIDSRTAVVYFDLQIDMDNIGETAADEDSPDAEYARELLSDTHVLLRLEQDAYNEIKKKLGALGFRVSDEGHDGNYVALICKFGVSSWVDVDRLNRWIQGHMGGGDDVVYLDTPYASVQGFTLYPRGLNGKQIGPPETSLGEWLEVTKPPAVERTHPESKAGLPLNVLATWSDGVELRRSLFSEKFFDGHWKPEEEIRFDLFIVSDGADRPVLSLFLAPMTVDILGPMEIQFVSSARDWRTEEGFVTRKDAICRLTWFFLSTLPEQMLRLEATASLLEDLRLPRYLPDSISQLTADHQIEQEAIAFHEDLKAVPASEAQEFISRVASMLNGEVDPKYGSRYSLTFSVIGSRYSLICEEVFYNADLDDFNPPWTVHADFFRDKRSPKATFCVVDSNDVVIGAGRTPREALTDVPFFVWPGTYEQWTSRMLQPGELRHKEETEVFLILDELPPFYRSDEDFVSWCRTRTD